MPLDVYIAVGTAEEITMAQVSLLGEVLGVVEWNGEYICPKWAVKAVRERSKVVRVARLPCYLAIGERSSGSRTSSVLTSLRPYVQRAYISRVLRYV